MTLSSDRIAMPFDLPSLAQPVQALFSLRHLQTSSRKDAWEALQRLATFAIRIAFCCWALCCGWACGIEVVGITVTPHQFSPNLQWRRPPDPELSARVEVYLRNDTDQTQTLLPGGSFDGAAYDAALPLRQKDSLY
jgi:hypothetical protein